MSLHAHGGGTVIFSMHLERKAVGHIANAAGARALVLDYRRLPEHRFPAQIEDMEKARRTSAARNACPSSLFSFSRLTVALGGNNPRAGVKPSAESVLVLG